jgi:hypothetical protein
MNRRPKIFYATQVAVQPPTIVLFTNGPELFANTYQRYLLKAFRDHLPFNDVPIKLYLRNKHREEAGDEEIEPVSQDKVAKPEAKARAKAANRFRKGASRAPNRRPVAKKGPRQAHAAKQDDSGLWKDV